MDDLVSEDGLELFGFRLVDNQLIEVGRPGFSEYLRMASYLGHCDRVTRWAIGDLLIAAEVKFGETYAQIEVATGMAAQDLMNCKWVAGKIEISRRREISWSHHSEVASLPPPQQDAILERAVSDGLNRSQVREAVREAKGLPPSKSDTPDAVPDPDTLSCPNCKGTGRIPKPVPTEGPTPKPRARKRSDDVSVLTSFEQFYAAYPRKKARKDAEKAWKKLNPDAELVQTILAAIEVQKNSPEWRKGTEFIPYPASWLNSQRWEDKPDAGPSEYSGIAEWLDRHPEEES